MDREGVGESRYWREQAVWTFDMQKRWAHMEKYSLELKIQKARERETYELTEKMKKDFKSSG